MKFRIIGNPQDSIKRAVFHCPGCDEKHSIHVSLEPWKPGNKAWFWNGSIEKPTVLPSILYNVGRSNPTEHLCHSFVTDGRIKFLQDCTHSLRNLTVDLPDWEVPWDRSL